MKKLLALALVALVLLSAPLSLALQFPRQVDPNSAPADPVYGQGLYLFYGSIVAALSGGNFTAAKNLLAQTSFIHIPPEILDTVNSFNGLVNSTSNLFSVIDSQLRNASSYISTGQLALARDNLTAAISNLRTANETLTQLFGAEPQLASLTGIPSSLLLQKLQPLETVYRADSAQANRLLIVLTGLTKLDPTTVTLSVLQNTITVGSNVSVSGTLSGPSAAPLPSRNVTIYFEDHAIGNVTTDSSGSFSGVFATPFFYQKNATMFASFLPRGNDSLVYAPSTSFKVNVTVDFATPDVALAVPRVAYAGQSMTVNGTLTLTGKAIGGYGVTLSGFKTSSLATPLSAGATSDPSGRFSITLVPSTGLSGGTYTLTLKTTSNGSVGPLTVPVSILLIKEDANVTATIPTFALAGFPVTISGVARANGTGVAGAQVLNTSPAPAVDSRTTSSGSFSFSVTPPLTTANGAWTYTVEVYPSQSWISAAPVSVTIFVINPLILLFPASSLGLLGLVVRRRRAPAQEAALAPTTVKEVLDKIPQAEPRTGIPEVYFTAVGLVEKATSVRHLPQMTVREYLREVEGKVKGFGHFTAISTELETFLYAGGTEAADEPRARSELESLRRELEG